MEGGNAVADILSGKVNPSGKLADTWAYEYEDYPNSEKFSHNNGNVQTELYEEGIYVGYRYFDTFEVPVRYGFGYGLSYTDFEISNYRLVKISAEKISILASVKNTGKVSRQRSRTGLCIPAGRHSGKRSTPSGSLRQDCRTETWRNRRSHHGSDSRCTDFLR